MTLQLVGAAHLFALMRAERLRDLDTSWLLHGPADLSEPEEHPEFEPWKIAAE